MWRFFVVLGPHSRAQCPSPPPQPSFHLILLLLEYTCAHRSSLRFLLQATETRVEWKVNCQAFTVKLQWMLLITDHVFWASTTTLTFLVKAVFVFFFSFFCKMTEERRCLSLLQNIDDWDSSSSPQWRQCVTTTTSAQRRTNCWLLALHCHPAVSSQSSVTYCKSSNFPGTALICHFQLISLTLCLPGNVKCSSSSNGKDRGSRFIRKDTHTFGKTKTIAVVDDEDDN